MKNQFKINDLTPIENHDGLYFKRDDLYTPFEDIPELSGSKVRAMQMLMEFLMKNNLWHHEALITYSGVSSAQALIVARIAHEYRIPCIVGVGVKEEALEKSIELNPSLYFAKQYNAEIISLARIGFNSTLKKRSTDMAKKLNYFLIDFGLNVERYTYAMIRGIANQVQNLPNDINNLIIPCSSGISTASILVGLKLFKKTVKRVIVIQISGFDRTKTIDKILAHFKISPNYEFYIDEKYEYKQIVKQTINDNFELSMVYEAKAYEYFQSRKEELKINEKDKNLFWCIGCNNFLYHDIDKKEKIEIVKKDTISLSIKDFKMLVNPCNAEMINNHCSGNCCNDDYPKLGHPLIVVLNDEQEKINNFSNEYMFSIDKTNEYLKPENKVCPFQDSKTNFCNLHNTDKKPFGCYIMPLTIIGNKIKCQKYFPKMKCQKRDFPNVEKVPFYIGFRQSLVAVFGEDETNRIVQEIENGNEDISVNISDENLEKMRQVKRIIGNVTKASKQISE
jgi:hypothetical protein